MNIVTKQDIQEYWEDEKNHKILNKCMRAHNIKREDREYYKFLSLARAMKYYDPIRGMRFTTYLYWTSTQILRKIKVKKIQYTELKDNRCYYIYDIMKISEIKADIDLSILEDKVIGNYSLFELSYRYGLSERLISDKIRKIRKKILDL